MSGAEWDELQRTPHDDLTTRSAAFLRATNVSKTFGVTKVLQNVDLEIVPEAVIGLVGENGSGKSTLIKIVAGYHSPDAGSALYFNDKQVALPLAPQSAARLPVRFVHQDLGLFSALSVTENFFARDLANGSLRPVSWKVLHARARASLAECDVAVDPRVEVGYLSAAERAMVAIVRAVKQIEILAGYQRRRGGTRKGCGLLVLDEPTVFLGDRDREKIHAIIRRVCSEGMSVLFVSHDLDEVLDLSDEVVVLRNGQRIASADPKVISRRELTDLMIGEGSLEPINAKVRQAADLPDQPFLEARNIQTRRLKPTSVELYAPEILGLTGLLGSGYADLLYVLAGAIIPDSGSLRVGSSEFPNLERYGVAEALKLGLALVPATRAQGGVSALTVWENVSLPSLVERAPLGRVRPRHLAAEARAVAERFGVTPTDPDYEFGLLSGGNQQKVVMAKWLRDPPPVLLLDEPTQGVDVGARAALWKMLVSYRDAGGTAVIASTDTEQLEALADRVLVFQRGAVAEVLSNGDVRRSRMILGSTTS